jgi:hypothetical protein
MHSSGVDEEHRDGATNIVVTQIGALQWREPKQPEVGGERQDPPKAHARGEELKWRRTLRKHAVSELQAVAPAGHSFGRRG